MVSENFMLPSVACSLARVACVSIAYVITTLLGGQEMTIIRDEGKPRTMHIRLILQKSVQPLTPAIGGYAESPPTNQNLVVRPASYVSVRQTM